MREPKGWLAARDPRHQTENPRIGCSIHPLATTSFNRLRSCKVGPRRRGNHFATTMTDEATKKLLAQIRQHIARGPLGGATEEMVRQWAAKALALVEHANQYGSRTFELAAIRVAQSNLGSMYPIQNIVNEIELQLRNTAKSLSLAVDEAEPQVYGPGAQYDFCQI